MNTQHTPGPLEIPAEYLPHIPPIGPVWLRLDASGAVIGWRSQYAGLPQAKALRQMGADAKQKWDAASVGETVKIPVRFHPRHGVIQETYLRAR